MGKTPFHLMPKIDGETHLTTGMPDHECAGATCSAWCCWKATLRELGFAAGFQLGYSAGPAALLAFVLTVLLGAALFTDVYAADHGRWQRFAVASWRAAEYEAEPMNSAQPAR